MPLFGVRACQRSTGRNPTPLRRDRASAIWWVLTCSKFLTTSDYAPRLRARLDVEQQLIDDVIAQSWPREIERHEATKRRLEQLLHDLA